MKTYDYIIRVGNRGRGNEDDESTMAIDDQREVRIAAIKNKNGRVGREHKAKNQSGSPATGGNSAGSRGPLTATFACGYR